MLWTEVIFTLYEYLLNNFRKKSNKGNQSRYDYSPINLCEVGQFGLKVNSEKKTTKNS